MASIWLILRFLCAFVFLQFYYRVLNDILFSFILTVYFSVVVSMIYIFQIQKISQPLIFRIVTASVFVFSFLFSPKILTWHLLDYLILASITLVYSFLFSIFLSPCELKYS